MTDRMMRTFEFTASQTLPAPLERVFEFFSDPRNLERITPPWVAFRIVTPGEIEMRAGALIDYRLRIRGVPMRWRTEITEWDPPHGFVDTQLRGPYRKWVHTHRFTARGAETLVEDHIEYAVPGGAFVERLFVRGDVERIFAYRRRVLDDLFVDGRAALPSRTG
ncbi:MAG: SRPBCC family protein [Gemmatimonadota bacterium]|nr:SRPBCC family protein [Gemmatimonadota bacterium]